MGNIDPDGTKFWDTVRAAFTVAFAPIHWAATKIVGGAKSVGTAGSPSCDYLGVNAAANANKELIASLDYEGGLEIRQRFVGIGLKRMDNVTTAFAVGIVESAIAEGTSNFVIGKVKDLGNPGKGESSLLELLPDQGSPKANYKQNSSVLRQVMKLGRPI